MPRKKTNSNPIRKEVKISFYLQRKIEELLETGDFTSESDVIRTAILNLAKEYETGKRSKKKLEVEERLERLEILVNEIKGQIDALWEEIRADGEERESES